MNQAVVAGALAVAALNAVAGLIGAWVWYRGDPVDERAARAFWIMLRVGQGSALTLADRRRRRSPPPATTRPKTSSTCTRCCRSRWRSSPSSCASPRPRRSSISAGLEGAEGVAALPEQEQQELVGQIVRREIGVMAVSALVVVFLALRAAGTAHGF